MGGRAVRMFAGLLASLMLVAAAGRALALDNVSPAAGHAEVIAHGVIPMPADKLTWRLYDGSAGPLDEAEPLTTEWPGFLLGGDTPILADVDGDRSIVSEGKAMLVRSGADLTVSSLDDRATGYRWLTLTDAELDTGNDALLFASDQFDALSGGDRQVDLIRDVLADGEETDLAAGSASTVLLVIAGEASVAVDGPGGDSERLEAGEDYVAAGALTVRARDGDTVIVAAVIGDEIPSGGTGRPRRTPTATPGEAVGAIEITVQTCAPGITVDEISDEACPYAEPEDDSLQLLTFDGTTQVGSLQVADLAPGQTGYVWTGLELRTHVLQVFASGGERVYVGETDQVAMIPGPQYEITLTEDEPYAFVPIFRLTDEGAPKEDGGDEVSTVTVTFLGCEAGQAPEFFRPENCYDAIDGSAAVASDDLGVSYGPENAEANENGSLTWTVDGYGDFEVYEVLVPDAYVDYALSEDVVSTGAGSPDAYVYVYAFLPVGKEE